MRYRILQNKIVSSISTLISNKNIVFISTKYLSYLISFVVGIVIANRLGVFYFGVYGFIKMLMQYLSYSNFGVNYSGLILMSQQDRNDDNFNNKILLSSLTCSIIIFAILYLVFVSYYGYFIPLLDEKYFLSNYLYYIFFIVLFKQINVIYINLFRVYNRLGLINIAFLLPCLAELVVLPFATGENLLHIVFLALAISNGIVMVIFAFSLPFKFRFIYEVKSTVKLISRGIKLLIYNTSYYFIGLFTKSFVSKFFSVTIFSQFIFAYNISDAIMLLNNSISFLLYPSVIKQSMQLSGKALIKYLLEIQEKYMLLANIIIIIAYMASPFLIVVTPQYSDSIPMLFILLFAQLLIANIFIMTTFLVQRKSENYLIVVGLTSLIILLITNLAGYYSIGSVIVVPVVLSLVLVFYNVFIALKTISKISKKYLFTLPRFLQYSLFLPNFIAVCSSFFMPYYISIALYISSFLFFHHKKLSKIINSYIR